MSLGHVLRCWTLLLGARLKTDCGVGKNKLLLSKVYMTLMQKTLFAIYH